MATKIAVRSLSHDVSLSFGTSVSSTSRNAASERYSAIWKFFKQQHTTSAHNIARKPWTTNTGSLHSAIVFRPPTSINTRRFCRNFHTTRFRSNEKQSKAGTPPEESVESQHTKEDKQSSEPSPPLNRFDNYPRFFRRLALSVPNIHRPTRDDLLNVANGFWQRARIRFRWFTIKSFRRFNADDISAFITWFVMSQTLWILVGT
jgi:distribution and morphology protein 31